MAADSGEANLELYITKANEETEEGDLSQLTHALLESLSDMDIEAIELLRDQDYLPGAKGAAVIAGGLSVSIWPAALPAVLEFLQRWVLRHEDYSVRAKIQRGGQAAEIEYTSTMSPDDLKSHLELIERLTD